MKRTTKNFLYMIFLILTINVLTACSSRTSTQNNNIETNNTQVINNTNIDTQIPVITRIGEDVNITLGETYTDAGANATDDIDGNITIDIVMVSNVDTSSIGTYTVSYDVNDKAGNSAEQVTRTVYVSAVPNVAPNITGNAKITTNIYSMYQFLPTANDANGDMLTYSIQNKPSWAEFNTSTGLLQGIPSAEGNSTNIIISVSDGTKLVSLAAFTIDVKPAINLAHVYGKATQGDIWAGHKAIDAIDENNDTYNHANDVEPNNWWQLKLPEGTKIHKIVIRNASYRPDRLNNAKMYLNITAHAVGSTNMGILDKTLTADMVQVFTYDPPVEKSYLLMQGNLDATGGDKSLHVGEVEVYGTLPTKPSFEKENVVARVNDNIGNGDIVQQVIGKDYQGDTLTYSISEQNVPFIIDAEGNIHATHTLISDHTYRFHVTISDALESSSTWVTVVTDKNEADTYKTLMDYSSDYNITNNMNGDLKGQLWFMQSQMHRPFPKEGEFRPLAVTYRSALLLFMMEDASSVHGIQMKVSNESGEEYIALLKEPSKLGLPDQAIVDNRAKLIFSKRSWTGEIPWNFMTPKMSIELTEIDENGVEKKRASLAADDIKLGAPHELVINNIDLGMLVEPRGDNQNVYHKYNKIAEYALNYFQTAPIAKYTVGRYAPAHFPKVVLDDGTVYTDKSASTDAGVYSGDMRWVIAKALVSTGINKANIGLISDKSQDDDHDRIIRQTLVHTARGKYTKPDTNESITVVHGLSGGAGKLTLEAVDGNEFSHEYGHDHGMSHYPGGIYSIHNYMSGWSYDTYKNRFIGNLRWKDSASPATHKNISESVTPFRGLYTYAKDSMANGNPNSSLFSKFTFYTPYTSYYIQKKLSASGMIDDNSPTGYQDWNVSTEKYDTKTVSYPKPTATKIPVMTLLGFYDPKKTLTTFIYPALYSNYGSYFSADVLNAQNSDDTCKIVLTKEDNTEVSYNLLSSRKHNSRMNQFQLNVPLSENYKKAKIICDNKVLDSRDIAPLDFDLKEPIIVGKEYGLKTALKQIRLFSEVFSNKLKFVTQKHFNEAFNTHYAPVQAYVDGVKVEEGDSFVVGTKYFIALADNASTPSKGSEDWRYLGDSKSYVALEKLTFGEKSEDYTARFGSSLYFLVPVDNDRVLASNAVVSGKWYGKTTTKITVQATNTLTGEKQAINIRAKIGYSYAIQDGRDRDRASVLMFYFSKTNNPELAAGEYAVSFYAIGRRWHKGDEGLGLLVEGVIVVE
jgi:hypothetical protein